MKRLLAALCIGTFLSGCDAITGKEVARLQISQLSNDQLVIKETKLDLKRGEAVAFWADMDIEYENELGLVYDIQVWRDTTMMGEFRLNALKTNPTFMEVKTTFGGKTSWSYNGKMDALKIEEGGNYTIKAIMRSSENPTLVINKAELVLKK